MDEHDNSTKGGSLRGIAETSVAMQFGLSVPRIREMRRTVLVEEDWYRAKNRVFLLPQGVEKIAALLRPAASPATSPPVSETSPALEAVSVGEAILASNPNGLIVELIVHRLVRNTRIVLCAHGTSIVRVRVRNSANFQPSMRLQARHVDGDVYELIGRCPRWKGRW